MEKAVLKHLLGIEGAEIADLRIEEGAVIVYVATPREGIRCPYCGSSHVRLQGSKIREIKSLPYGETPVLIRLRVHRMECYECGKHPQEQFSFVDPGVHHTKLLEVQSARDCMGMTIKDAAQRNGLRWHSVRNALRNRLQESVRRIDLSGIRRIAVDEIYVARRVFMTVVLDLDTHSVVHVVEGQGRDALRCFFADARDHGARIEAVAMDMSPPTVMR